MLTELQKKNKELIDKYPFLLPRNVWTGKEIKDYDYSYTLLDDMPEGWRKAFGEQLCEELKQELVRHDYLDEYMILQIKEKYGELRWYSGPIPIDCNADEIVDKYSNLSRFICIQCGKPATKISKGWISPWCDDCVKSVNVQSVPIQEFYNFDKMCESKEFTFLSHYVPILNLKKQEQLTSVTP